MMTQGDDAVAFCRAQIGKRYVWGTSGPQTYDCSGLVYRAYRSVTPPVYLGRTTYEQIFDGKDVKPQDLQVGDLIFPYADISHVQIYSGGGNVIEAPNKDIPVRETRVTTIARARRVGSVSDDDEGFDLAAVLSGQMAIPGLPNQDFDIPDGIPIIGRSDDAARDAAKFWRTITLTQFWWRVGTTAVGTAIVIWGILFLNRGLVIGAFNNVYNTGKELAGGLAQGFAFGAGAGGLGGTGAGGGGLKPKPAIEAASPPGSPIRTTATVQRPARALPNPSGLTTQEFIDRDIYRFGKQEKFPRPHNPKLSKGGTSP